MSIANIPQLTLESASPRDHEMLKKLTTMAASLEHGGGQMLPDPSGYLFWQLDCSPSKLAEAFEISFRHEIERDLGFRESRDSDLVQLDKTLLLVILSRLDKVETFIILGRSIV